MTSSKQLSVSEAFREAFIHDRHIILGREMQPYCLDHIQILEALRSPLILGGPILIEDAQLAVKACSTSTTFEYYDAALRPNASWRKWGKLTREYPISAFVGLWNRYVEDYAPAFPQWRTEDGEDSKCPDIFLSAGRLVGRGHDPVKVRRMGLGELTAWNLAVLESEGNPLKSLKNDTEVQAQREIDAEEAQS